jgi:ABC-type multidrug transport system permease subunit
MSQLALLGGPKAVTRLFPSWPVWNGDDRRAVMDVLESGKWWMYSYGEKELGTYEQLSVTPLRRWEIIVGKLLPYALIGMVDVFLVVGLAVFWFQVPLRGSLVLLFLLSLVYLLNTLGIGLFVSTSRIPNSRRC